MKRAALLFLVVVLVLPLASGQTDVCYQPFESFLQCLVGSAHQRLNTFTKENSLVHKNRISSCFVANGCNAPQFGTRDALNVFLPQGKWRTRVEALISLLNDMPVAVQTCMITYFKRHATDLVQECVRQNGVSDFVMPTIPGLKDFDIREVKDVLIARMLQSHQAAVCVGCKGEPAKLRRIVKCTDRARDNFDSTLCQVRSGCTNRITGTCRQRFDAVHAAGCKCLKKGGQRPTGLLRNLRTEVIGGGIERTFRGCYASAGVAFPEKKFTAVKTAITDSILQLLLSRKVPEELKYTVQVAKAAIKEFSSKWKGVFCSECTNDQYDSEDSQVRGLNKLAKHRQECLPKETAPKPIWETLGGGNSGQRPPQLFGGRPFWENFSPPPMLNGGNRGTGNLADFFKSIVPRNNG